MVDPTAFYIAQVEIDARIDTLVAGIQTKIDDIVSHLDEDVITGFISVKSGESSQFQKKLKVINDDFKWYKNLAGADKTFFLIGAYAEDYSNSNKEVYVLDKVSISN